MQWHGTEESWNVHICLRHPQHWRLFFVEETSSPYGHPWPFTGIPNNIVWTGLQFLFSIVFRDVVLNCLTRRESWHSLRVSKVYTIQTQRSHQQSMVSNRFRWRDSQSTLCPYNILFEVGQWNHCDNTFGGQMLTIHPIVLDWIEAST